jgi:hypothetical protein
MTSGQKGNDFMADEKKWETWEEPGKPEGKGGTSMHESDQGAEVAGRTRQMVAVCAKCGMQSYVGADWKWFTCWKCGGTSADVQIT